MTNSTDPDQLDELGSESALLFRVKIGTNWFSRPPACDNETLGH